MYCTVSYCIAESDSLVDDVPGLLLKDVLHLEVAQTLGAPLAEDLGDDHDVQRGGAVGQRLDDVLLRALRLHSRQGQTGREMDTTRQGQGAEL